MFALLQLGAREEVVVLYSSGSSSGKITSKCHNACEQRQELAQAAPKGRTKL